MSERAISGRVVRSAEETWRTSSTPGVSVRVLRADKATGESTLLIRFEAGARFPAHTHPGGEELFVLEGDLQVGRDRLSAGDYLYTPPGGTHAASSEDGCLILVALPRPIEVLLT
jgi:quercetin dioxygenase-like cupin family protein